MLPIWRYIFTCTVLLILFSQYGNTTTKSRYLESILAALERIEKVFKQTERNSEFGCIVPCKLLNSALDLPTLPDKEEIQVNLQKHELPPSDANNLASRKSLLSNRNVDNLNANININGQPYGRRFINTGVLSSQQNFNRRNFDNSVISSNQIANQNVNMNRGFGKYLNKGKFEDDYL